jgi:hypothetical protein
MSTGSLLASDGNGPCLSPSLKLLEDVLSDYRRFKKNRLLGYLGLIEEVVADWIEIQNRIKESNRSDGAAFNPLSRLKIKETAHSRILGDLLNPFGSHGQGALFLEAFLRFLEIPEPDKGPWNVTVEAGRVDIMLWREKPVKSAIIIENKSNNAGDQPNQIYRYWHHQLYLWDPPFWDSKLEPDQDLRHRLYHVVYLPTDGGKSPSPHSLERPAHWETVNPHERVPLACQTLSLSALLELWLRKSPLIPSTNIRLRVFLAQYQELWNP